MISDHDWRGRPYMQTVDAHDPLVLHLTFWTDGPANTGGVPEVGDLLILRHSMQDHGARYEVTDVGAWLGEGEVHGLTARFEARARVEIEADVEKFGASKPRPVAL